MIGKGRKIQIINTDRSTLGEISNLSDRMDDLLNLINEKNINDEIINKLRSIEQSIITSKETALVNPEIITKIDHLIKKVDILTSNNDANNDANQGTHTH